MTADFLEHLNFVDDGDAKKLPHNEFWASRAAIEPPVH